MYKYVKDENGENSQEVIEKLSGGFIPNDPANKDWQAYQEWLAQGNQPLAAD